jgi:hypothetical protein
MLILKPYHGRMYGCMNCPEPVLYTPEQLSRLLDKMFEAQRAGEDPEAILNAAPKTMQQEWRYTWWYYVAEEVEEVKPEIKRSWFANLRTRIFNREI